MADPQPGDVYYQEYCAGEAEDQAEVAATDAAVLEEEDGEDRVELLSTSGL